MVKQVETKTYMAKAAEVERVWWVVDLDGVVLGRAATKIARVLMGKHKPTYTPHLRCGDFVVAVNVDKVRLTGKKRWTKTYPYYTGYPSGYREKTVQDLFEKDPGAVLRNAVKRMLPKSALGKSLIKQLKAYGAPDYPDGSHPHEAQQPKPLDLERI